MSTPRQTPSTSSPTVDQFAQVLSGVPSWYNLGMFLGAPTTELDTISDNYSRAPEGTLRCLIELYKCMEKEGKSLSWNTIVTTLKKMGNYYLARKIYLDYIISSHQPRPPTSDQVPVQSEPLDAIALEYQSLSDRFNLLVVDVKEAFMRSQPNVDIMKMQDLINLKCGLPKLPQDTATIDGIFDRVFVDRDHCSIVNCRVLVFLVENLLCTQQKPILMTQLEDFIKVIDGFKSSTNMVQLVTLIQSKQTTPTGNHKEVKLKVREFWSDFTMSQFEIIVNKIFHTLYNIMTHVTVGTGCIFYSWIIPDIDTTELVPVLSLELIRLIGVIYLHIGNKTIYNIEGDGCESIEAAMLQAIELKNTRAIELLLAVGCSPQIATYTDSNTVTNIVNIKAIESGESSSGSNGSVDHVCILGHNKHVEAIIDPSNEPECSSYSMKDKMIKELRQEVESLRNNATIHTKKNEELASEIELQLTEEMKLKDSEIISLKRTNKRIMQEAMLKNKSSSKDNVLPVYHKDESSVLDLPSNSTAVLPHRRRRLGINTEMKVKVITSRDNNGKELVTGGSRSVVRAILTCNEEECPVTDNNDGTYTITVIPQQLGQHQLSITVNSEYIEDSPFTLDIVPQRDYTQFNKPIQEITDIRYPMYIAFADNGDMFVTSADHHIHVYDMKGYKKTTIGSGRGGGELQFNYPRGIDVYGEVVYVADTNNHRIQQVTTEGKFMGTFGQEGSFIGQFNDPYDVKISPVDGKVYVADTYNNRIQVFNPDWSISYVIDGSTVSGVGEFVLPRCIALDQSGNIHVGHGESSIIVLTFSGGHLIRHYGDQWPKDPPYGICIDPSGYSLVTSDHSNGTLSIYNSKGTFTRSVSNFHQPHGVSISPVDGSVWVANTMNRKLLLLLSN